MKVIEHFYSRESKWIDTVSEVMGGIVDGNFITGDNEVYSGTHFFLRMGDQISAMVIDTIYKETVLLKYKSEENRFVGLYFYVNNFDVNFIQDHESAVVGKLDFNLTMIDCSLDTEYVVQKGTGMYIICIFIDKKALKEYMDEKPKLRSVSQDFFNAEKNTIISMGRMGTDSLLLINEFRKVSYNSPMLDFFFRGLVYKLIGNYMEQLLTKKFIISKVLVNDVKLIIASKVFLLESIEGVFPGIDFLARQVFMSVSKYKKLFTKISGLSPGIFFYSNKLERAKELLETGKYTVSEIAEKLNYANVSYLAKRFNSKYGILPKEYQSLL